MAHTMTELAKSLQRLVDAHNRAVDRVEALEKKVSDLEAASRQPVYVNVREVARIPTVVTKTL